MDTVANKTTQQRGSRLIRDSPMGEKRQYREYPTVILVGVSQVQSAHDAVDMFFDGALGNPQPPSDSGIDRPWAISSSTSSSRWDKADNGSSFAPCGQQLAHQLWIDDRTATGNTRAGVSELSDIPNPALQEITHPVARGDQLRRVFDLDVRRQHQHTDAGMLAPDLLGRFQPLGGMGRWHPNIDDDEIRALRSNQFQQRRGIPARPTTSKPTFSRTLATPSRSNVSSSATRTRIADISPGYRRHAGSRSASPPILLIGERAARRFTGSE